MSENRRGYATGVFKTYRVVKYIPRAPWRTGMAHLVPGVRFKYRGVWYFNQATER